MKRYLFFIFFFVFFYYQIRAQIITTIAGDSTLGHSGDGGPATAASLFPIYGIAMDTIGNLFISNNHPVTAPRGAVVRKVNTSGIISTFAGTDTLGFSGDGGPATAAWLSNTNCIAFDKKGNVYIADMIGNRRVRKVDAAGIITTFAGNGSSTPSGDGGPATAAGLGSGAGVCSDILGNIYIAAGNKIRKVDTFGIITTFAGNGTGSYSGDGGPATAASINCQGQITIDRHGNMYVTDVVNQRVRKISPGGIITTIAGNGTVGFSGDGGPATLAQLHDPIGVCTDNCDNLYIADSWNQRVRIVNGSGMIKTIAGNGFGGGTAIGGYNGDGIAATAAKLNLPNSLCVDNNGSIYIADNNNARVRYIHMDSCRNTTGVATPPGLPEGEGMLRVFPNPGDGAFMVRVSSGVNVAVQITVTNIMGQKIKEISAATNKDVPIQLRVPKGMYFVNATTEKQKYAAKVIVQ
jgi:hypothetical protein